MSYSTVHAQKQMHRTKWNIKENKPTLLQSFDFLQRCHKYFGNKIASSTNGVGKTGYPHVED
jgi:hypothetical protein